MVLDCTSAASACGAVTAGTDIAAATAITIITVDGTADIIVTAADIATAVVVTAGAGVASRHGLSCRAEDRAPKIKEPGIAAGFFVP